MSRKTKGINAERELIHLLWAKGFAALRVAGSGSMRYPSPDIIAGKLDRKIAIECKTSIADRKYIPWENIGQLIRYAAIFGAEPWLAVRFSKTPWLFLSLDDITQVGENVLITKEQAQLKGLLLEEVIR
ncbi:TPA: Holliday junction resolvase [Candidatus Woesearchaeota archaeon]|nr:Holliday junction resolvase [Candidatus Woesearchaeota archaeon]